MAVKSRRWWQFSLRSLLGMTTVVCIGLAAYVGRQRYLEHSVHSFNALIDEQRYPEAERLAKHVDRWYGTVLTEAMVEKAAFATTLSWHQSDGSRNDGTCGFASGSRCQWLSAENAK